MSSSSHTFRNFADKLFHKDTDATKEEKGGINAHGTHVKEEVHNHSSEHLHDAVVDPASESDTQVWQQGLKPATEAVVIDAKSPISAVQAGAPVVHTHTFAPVVETHINPTVLEQTTRKETLVEVQPIVHRLVEEPEHHVIEQHIYEKVPSIGPTTITKRAIIEETVKPRIIEEIQPVLHRDVPAPYIQHVEKHISEHEVLPTTYSKEVLTKKRDLSVDEALSRGLAEPAPIISQEAPLVHSHVEAPIIDTQLNATLVETTIRPEKVTEIQPIIHREIDAPEIHYREKHMYESVPMTGPNLITKAPIVEENIRPKIVEEIVPVVHREVPKTVVEHVEEHVTENVVAPIRESIEVIAHKREVEGVALLPNELPGPSTPLVVSSTAAPTLTSHTRPTIVDETLRPEKVVEVQPIIHKEVDAPEVHVVEQHLYEKVPSTGPKQVTKQVIVEETVVPKVVEEIRPVVHREIPVAIVEQVEAHSAEKIMKKLVETREKTEIIDGKGIAAISLTSDEQLETATRPSGKNWSASSSSKK